MKTNFVGELIYVRWRNKFGRFKRKRKKMKLADPEKQLSLIVFHSTNIFGSCGCGSILVLAHSFFESINE